MQVFGCPGSRLTAVHCGVERWCSGGLLHGNSVCLGARLRTEPAASGPSSGRPSCLSPPWFCYLVCSGDDILRAIAALCQSSTCHEAFVVMPSCEVACVGGIDLHRCRTAVRVYVVEFL